MPGATQTAERPYELPGLWGSVAERTAAAWREQRAPQLVDLYSEHVYGRTPRGGELRDVREASPAEAVFGGAATRREYALTLGGPLGGIEVSMLVYTPQNARGDAPVLFGLNFEGNHSTTDDEAVRVSEAWVKEPAPRGHQSRRWPYERAVERGYAVATIHYAELEEDRPGPSAADGVRGLFQSADELAHRSPDDWGAVGAWAWGCSRALDAIERIPGLDAARVIVHGHSRLGKTALWAAAQDERFAAAISNDSGCAGASLFRHRTERGETVRMITDVFPHWFCPRFDDYRDAEDRLPVDQHHLTAAILPRPVHVASAVLDAHADPRGEYLGTIHASPIAALHGGRGTAEAPAGADIAAEEAISAAPAPIGRRVGGLLSYHIREGVHDVLVEDWEHFMDFAEANGVGATAE